MADGTKIEWADATVNAVNGCSLASPGCTNCYAMRLAGTRMRSHTSREGLTEQTKAGPVWNGQVRLNEKALMQPLRWRRPRHIFWNAHGDLFHENVPDWWIDRVFAVAGMTPQHIHMILTKRSSRMLDYLSIRKTDEPVRVSLDDWTYTEHPWNNQLQPPKNVWLGVSVEDQKRANERIPDLLETPAALRFLSCEPLLGQVDIREFLRNPLWSDMPGWKHPAIDWVIVGGESGPGARPMHPDWARSLRDQCAVGGTPFHFKQWGERAPFVDRDRQDPDWRLDYSNLYADHGNMKWLNLEGGCGFHGERFYVMSRAGKKCAGRLLDGVEHNGMQGGAA